MSPLLIDEAEQIADIVATADGGCTSCALDLAEMLTVAFPEHDWDALVRLGIDHATDTVMRHQRTVAKRPHGV